ncbi:MAG: DUF3604 domain-containing protein [Bryobacteraceae bacterium]
MTLAVCLLALGLTLSRSQNESPRGGYQTNARYQSEDAAVDKGEKLGIGEVTWEGPREVVVDSLASFKLKYTAGRAGMKAGGGIRLASAHGMGTDWGGQALQATGPQAENFLAYRTSRSGELQWISHQAVAKNPLFARYHPWQNINEFKLAGAALQAGGFIEITLSRVRMQRWDESAFTLKFYIDASGDDDYLPLRKNPQIRIVGERPVEINVIARSDWVAGQPGSINVWLGDRFGNPSESYRGTVVLEGAGAPVEHTFQASNRGVWRATPAPFSKPGVYRVRAREKNGSLEGTGNPIVVHQKPPRRKLYWGDIHTHTMYSDGRGSPAETYDFGRRIAALDFAAVTDHSFITTDAMWRDIQETTNKFYQPGQYVTFLGYEWSGMTDVGGDHNVYTTETSMPIIRCYSYFNYENLRMYRGPDRGANHVEDLFRMLGQRFRNENILVIPHYGGRQGNPAFHNPQLQRQIEIFSDHRRSEDWVNQFLRNGRRVGIMASTDNHAGNAGYGVRRNEVVRGEEGAVFSRTSPAERGTSLIAAYADALTREGIFQAMYHRQTYATTGSRIILRFEVDGAPMGSEIRASRRPRITASAEGTAPIRTFRIVKNGRIIHAVEPASSTATIEYVDTSDDYSKAFYYVDLVQTDGEKAISSPVWVN